MGDLVLVTGGAGYVGSHVTRKLLARGHRVRVLDNFVYGNHGLDEVSDDPEPRADLTGDICDERDARRARPRVRAPSSRWPRSSATRACDLDPGRTMAINYESTRQTLAACRAAGVERLVFASSCSVYGANGARLPPRGLAPEPGVAVCAHAHHVRGHPAQRSRDVEVVILRLATVCGVSPRMRFDLMVNTMTACAAGAGRDPRHRREAVAAARARAGRRRGIHARRRGAVDEGADLQRRLRRPELHRRRDRRAGRRARAGDAYRLRPERARSAQLPRDLRPHPQRRSASAPKRTVDDAISEVGGLLSSGVVADFRHDSSTTRSG